LRLASTSKPSAFNCASVVRYGTSCASAARAASKLAKADCCSLRACGSRLAQPANAAPMETQAVQAMWRMQPILSSGHVARNDAGQAGRAACAALIERKTPCRRLPSIRLGISPPQKGFTMDSTTSTADTKVNGKLAHNLRHFVDEAEQMLRTVADSGDRQFDAVRSTFHHQLQRMRLQLDELEDTAAHKARQAARAADRTVHTHPYGAMGVTAAIGLLVGLLVGRRG
jgi:ElaB/YqjD/DUF883 family membrane-anchored ribosome-binding protein